MEMVALILLLFGLISIWIEFYVPGGVLAIIGGIFVLVSMLTFFATSESYFLNIVYFIFCLASIACVIRLAIWRIKKSSSANSFYLNQDQEGYKAASIETDLTGKTGIAFTDLKPSGYIIIDSRKYPALCKGPYLDKGSQVIVVNQEGAHLIVKSAN